MSVVLCLCVVFYIPFYTLMQRMNYRYWMMLMINSKITVSMGWGQRDCTAVLPNGRFQQF